MKNLKNFTKDELIKIINELYTIDENREVIDKFIYPKSTDDELIELHTSGLSASQIADKTGLSVQRVMYTLKKYGVYTPAKKGRRHI